MPRRLLHLRPWRRHSSVLAVASIVYACYGVALWAIPLEPSRQEGLIVAVQVMPVRWWGIAWIGVGILALASTRWPAQSETWGYVAMSWLATFWSACYGLGILVAGTALQGITACLVWAMVAFLWWGISGLANPGDGRSKPVAFDWSVQPERRPRRRGRR